MIRKRDKKANHTLTQEEALRADIADLNWRLHHLYKRQQSIALQVARLEATRRTLTRERVKLLND